MAVFNEPSKWQTSLVNSGDANVIPQSTPVGTGKASFKDGFPQITQIPLSAGGQAPDRKDFNGLFKILGDWIFFNQNGGLPTYSENFDYVAGRVVSYNDNIYKCIQANGVSSTVVAPDSDTAYWSKIPTLADFDEIGFKTGDIKIQTTSTIPAGWLLCNGARVSRSTFSNLFTKIGTTYGMGDGSTTFNIPDLRDRYIIGANTNALGTYIAEQLPNIKGEVGDYIGVPGGQSGALSFSSTGNPVLSKVEGGTFDAHWSHVKFDAYSSNNIYTDNGHVYPKSIALNFIIKA